jgi:hypothetical protein
MTTKPDALTCLDDIRPVEAELGAASAVIIADDQQ